MEIYSGKPTSVYFNKARNRFYVNGEEHMYTCHDINIIINGKSIGIFGMLTGKIKDVVGIYLIKPEHSTYTYEIIIDEGCYC